MSTTTIQLQVRLLGKKRPVIAPTPITLPATLSATPTLRELLAVIVQQQVTVFNEVRNNAPVLPYLQTATIATQATQGKVSFGDHYNSQTVDIQTAVENTWQAYEDGLFLVFVDDKKVALLDDEVILQTDTQLMFMRLVALVGGYF